MAEGWRITAIQSVLKKARAALGLQVDSEPASPTELQDEANWLHHRLQGSRGQPGIGGTQDDRGVVRNAERWTTMRKAIGKAYQSAAGLEIDGPLVTGPQRLEDEYRKSRQNV